MFNSSRDPKTIAFICCSNTIMNNECELNISCSQTGQCQTQYYVLINHIRLPHFKEYSFRMGLFTHSRQRHVLSKSKKNKKCVRKYFHTAIQRYNNPQKLKLPLKRAMEFLIFTSFTEKYTVVFWFLFIITATIILDF